MSELQTDPVEMQNLALKRTEVTARFHAALLGLVAQFEAGGPIGDADPELDDYLVEYLRALGYLD